MRILALLFSKDCVAVNLGGLIKTVSPKKQCPQSRYSTMCCCHYDHDLYLSTTLATQGISLTAGSLIQQSQLPTTFTTTTGGNNSQSSEHYYAYNEQGLLLGEYNIGDDSLVEYIWFNGQPLAQIREGQVYYYHNDHLGTPRALTDSNQQVVWAASYTPFGEASLTVEAVENNLRFPGQYFDGETQLHYNWFRYYDPSTGRYLTSDPLGLFDGANTYAYVQNNPLIYSDPKGLFLTPQTIGGDNRFTWRIWLLLFCKWK